MSGAALLTKQEKDKINKKIGKTASSLAMSVARLFLAPTNGGGWQYTGVWGVISLIFDRSHESKPKFIKIFDIQTQDVLFSTELYESMSYVQSKPYFHAFETDNAIVGLCFVNDECGNEFYGKVLSYIPTPQASAGRDRGASTNKPTGLMGKIKGFFGKSEVQGDISGPTGFKHEQHIGYDPDKGFELNNIPEQWKAIFKSAGIKKQDLLNPETAKIIFDTVASFGASPNAAPAAPSNDVPAAPDDVPDAPPPPSIEVSDAPQMVIPSHSDSGSATTKAKQPAAPDTRGDLLSQIRSGQQLRKVDQADKPLPKIEEMNSQQTQSLLSTLQAAMANRRVDLVKDDGDEKKPDDDEW